MSRQSDLLDLVVEWEDRRANGQAISPEQLCLECPSLLAELKESLRAIAGMDAVLGVAGPPSGEFDGPTHLHSVPAHEPPSARREHWPVIPQYEILEELGRGGMGVVFKARQTALGRVVTVKTILTHGTIQEEQRRRFMQEAKAMAVLQHPNIVQIHEVGESAGTPFLVMEYVEGESVSAHLAGRPLPARKAAELIAVLARAMHAAHTHGIVHRDLKPSNVLLAADGTPKVCDFGLAKHFENPTERTLTGQVVGTPGYMAPEQVLGLRDRLGPTVDIYALGAMLYETLAGRPPFLADNVLDTIDMVVKKEPVPPRQWQPKTPRDLETICLKCLNKDPRRRYPSAMELAEDLSRFLAHEPIHARPVSCVERIWRSCRAHPSLAAMMVMTATAIVAVLAVALTYNRRLAQELDHTDAARRQVLAAQEKLHHTLAQEVADRLDGDLRELAEVPLTMTTLLENRRDWSDQEVEGTLKGMLRKTPLICGLCVAFEPFEWRKDREDFALYVFRRQSGPAVTQLLPPDYRPHYRQWDWYRTGRNSPQGGWCEPYIDESPDHTPMVTFSAPIHRDGRFVGVVTADLAMDYFRDLRGSMDRLDMGPGSYGFVVSSGHRILAHLVDRYEFPGPDSDLNNIPLDPSFRQVADQWGRLPAGSARAIDF